MAAALWYYWYQPKAAPGLSKSNSSPQPKKQNRVIDFVRKAGEIRPLTPDELGEPAREMAEAKDPAEADRLQAEIVRGFYGGRPDA